MLNVTAVFRTLSIYVAVDPEKTAISCSSSFNSGITIVKYFILPPKTRVKYDVYILPNERPVLPPKET